MVRLSLCGDPLYFSPERLRAHLGLVPSGTLSGAGPADDVYGLGVTAFRLLTDNYPYMEVDEEQRTQERLGGKPPRAPHELNPRAPPELETLVLRMLAARPEERPSAQEVAQAMEPLAEGAEASWDEPLFERLQSRVEYERLLVHARIEEGQRRVAAELARLQAAKRKPAPSVPPRRWTVPWPHVAGAVLLLGVVSATVLGLEWKSPHEEQATKPDRGTVGLGEDVLGSASTAPSGQAPTEQQGVEAEMPTKPRPGQKRPPCDPRWEVEIQGGCWFALPTVKAPCGVVAYEWQGACYFPVQPAKVPATSEPR